MDGAVRVLLLVLGLSLAGFLAGAGALVRHGAPKGQLGLSGGLLLAAAAVAAGMLLWFFLLI